MAYSKRIVITVTETKEDIQFFGDWTGRDVRKVLVHLPKKYRLYKRTVRRTDTGVPVGPTNLDDITKFKKENELE